MGFLLVTELFSSLRNRKEVILKMKGKMIETEWGEFNPEVHKKDLKNIQRLQEEGFFTNRVLDKAREEHFDVGEDGIIIYDGRMPT